MVSRVVLIRCPPDTPADIESEAVMGHTACGVFRHPPGGWLPLCNAAVHDQRWGRGVFFTRNSTPSTDGCWLWTKRIRADGYGQTKSRGRTWSAHRLAWAHANGPIPDGLCVLHRCDVRRCINPDHLFLGTYLENRWDCCRKGRQGSVAKLTADKVLRLRERVANGEPRSDLALEYGISEQTVSVVVRRLVWRHVQ